MKGTYVTRVTVTQKCWYMPYTFRSTHVHNHTDTQRQGPTKSVRTGVVARFLLHCVAHASIEGEKMDAAAPAAGGGEEADGWRAATEEEEADLAVEAHSPRRSTLR